MKSVLSSHFRLNIVYMRHVWISDAAVATAINILISCLNQVCRVCNLFVQSAKMLTISNSQVFRIVLTATRRITSFVRERGESQGLPLYIRVRYSNRNGTRRILRVRVFWVNTEITHILSLNMCKSRFTVTAKIAKIRECIWYTTCSESRKNSSTEFSD